MKLKRKLYSSINNLEERLYFLGRHTGKFGKGGEAAGVVFTGEELKNTTKPLKIFNQPKTIFGIYGPREKFDTVRNGYRMEQIWNKGLKADKVHTPSELTKIIKKQKFNRSLLGKLVKKLR